jgi:hypothetical protein
VIERKREEGKQERKIWGDEKGKRKVVNDRKDGLDLKVGKTYNELMKMGFMKELVSLN